MDAHGFVVDFSSLQLLEKKLKQQFDHTFLVNTDDPLLSVWEDLSSQEALDLRVMENVGMEYTSKLIWEWANSILLDKDGGRTCCSRAQAIENHSNSGFFDAIPEWFRFD